MNKSSCELWAVIYIKDGSIAYSRGGSSTSPRLMVYPSQKRALAAVNNRWTHQVLGNSDITIRCIYSSIVFPSVQESASLVSRLQNSLAIQDDRDDKMVTIDRWDVSRLVDILKHGSPA